MFVLLLVSSSLACIAAMILLLIVSRRPPVCLETLSGSCFVHWKQTWHDTCHIQSQYEINICNGFCLHPPAAVAFQRMFIYRQLNDELTMGNNERLLQSVGSRQLVLIRILPPSINMSSLWCTLLSYSPVRKNVLRIVRQMALRHSCCCWIVKPS